MNIKQILLGILIGIALAVVVVLGLSLTRPAPESVASPPSAEGEVVVTVSEPFLSAFADDLLRAKEESIEEVTVDVLPQGQVDVYLTVTVRILNMPMTLSIQLVNSVQLQGQELQFTLLSIHLGALDISPEWVPASLQELINTWTVDAARQANQALRDAQLVPVSLSTDETHITLGLRWTGR
jgi:hypothetical protein